MSTLSKPEPHKWIVVRVIDKRDWSVAEKHHAVHLDELGETIWELLCESCAAVGISTQAYHPMSINDLTNYTLENDKHAVKIEVADALTHAEMVERGLLDPEEGESVHLDPAVWGGLWSDRAAQDLSNTLAEND